MNERRSHAVDDTLEGVPPTRPSQVPGASTTARTGRAGLSESPQARLPFDDPPKRRRQAALRSFHTRRQPVGVGEALAGEARAQRQEDAIYEWFRSHPVFQHYTPSQVAADFPQWPTTSIRRALTNMTARGLLVHYPRDRRPGPYGSPESTWGLR